jgi:hypothetical protein
MIKEFVLKKMLLAKGVPESQIDMVMTLMEKNPDLFKKIAAELQERVKAGRTQEQAMMEVLPKYKQQLQQLAQK